MMTKQDYEEYEEYNNGKNVIPGNWVKIPSHSGILPLSMGIAAQSIGFDLVAVKPMSLPSSNLLYDYGNISSGDYDDDDDD